jgi:GntR family transcriptional regulator
MVSRTLDLDGRRVLSSEPRRKAAYQELAERLREDIAGQRYKDGARMPTEVELTAAYGVSRHTVRRAYLELHLAGLVDRVPGRGTFAARPIQYVRPFGSVDELLALSVDTEMEILEPLGIVSDPVMAAKLALQFDEVARVGFRRFHEELPFCFTFVYLPPRVAEALTQARFLTQAGARSRSTIIGLLDRALPHRIAGSRQTVTAVAAPADVAVAIDCQPSQPVLRIERLHFDDADRPVELCVNYFHPERYSYRSQLRRGLA